MNSINDTLVSYKVVGEPRFNYSKKEKQDELLFDKYNKDIDRIKNILLNRSSLDHIYLKKSEEPPLNTDSGFYEPTTGFSFEGENSKFKDIDLSNGSNTISTIYSFFRDKGFEDFLIGGILGNIIGESGLKLDSINEEEKNNNLSGYGRGLVQWSGSRVLDFKRKMGIEPLKATLLEQLNYIWYEMNLRSTLMNALRNSTSLEESSDIFYRGYENGDNNKLATPEKMTEVYTKSWKENYNKVYNFKTELNKRIIYGYNALKYK